ncbi:phage holin family protein [Nocardioides rubriscoriae]|uniref:phage holin family protein n=1 Tax=Nocardioides rubriscoriae TaxID=642762 RepID=UPI001B870F01|nr:phage holin family protein [Nocardioides rubriscoriae]
MSAADPYAGSQAVGATHDPDVSAGTRSLGEIVGEVTDDLSTLMKQELELAKVELKQEATKAGKGAGMLVGAALGGLMLLVFLSLALMWLLDDFLMLELAAFIVALLWGAVAATLAVLGRKHLKNANPQLPKTQQTLQEDARWAKTQTS